jgi:hypothetical protein
VKDNLLPFTSSPPERNWLGKKDCQNQPILPDPPNPNCPHGKPAVKSTDSSLGYHPYYELGYRQAVNDLNNMMINKFSKNK